MKILDPGHRYELHTIDGNNSQILQFVKRMGDNYPGNDSSYPGTNIQDVIRCLIDRVLYLDGQIPSGYNAKVISALRVCLINLEDRASERHSMHTKDFYSIDVENISFCQICGHWTCKGH